MRGPAPRTAPLRPCPRLQLAGEGPEPEQRDPPHRLGDDRARHLGRPGAALDERDRHLANAQSRAGDPVGRPDLEDVSGGGEAVEADALGGSRAKALEPAREVAARQPEEGWGVGPPAAGAVPANEPPVRGAPPGA